jgi:formylglycine-generating enzyme required for sulfatase activity
MAQPPLTKSIENTMKIAARTTGLKILPIGEFSMGGIPEDKYVSAVEVPRHRVKIDHLVAIGDAPVTRSEWFELMGSLPPGEPVDHADECPVVNVTFSEVMGYLRELSIVKGQVHRLPSEAEWEYACRAGTNTVFPNGSILEVGSANYFYDEHGSEVGPGSLTPVGSFPPNKFDLCDMLGNVCEWTADLWHPNFLGAPSDGSAWLADGKPQCRVIRGGAWDHLPRVLRASWRDWAPEQARWDNLGFRVARTL